jgi:hypothetical protein
VNSGVNGVVNGVANGAVNHVGGYLHCQVARGSSYRSSEWGCEPCRGLSALSDGTGVIL